MLLRAFQHFNKLFALWNPLQSLKITLKLLFLHYSHCNRFQYQKLNRKPLLSISSKQTPHSLSLARAYNGCEKRRKRRKRLLTFILLVEPLPRSRPFPHASMYGEIRLTRRAPRISFASPSPLSNGGKPRRV